MHEDRLLDPIFHPAAVPAVEPTVGEEKEPDHFSVPDAERDSGSERSFRSQKSIDRVSLGKTFQTHPSHLKSNSNSHCSNSHHSNGSHGYTFNNSYVHSNGSHGDGSQRRLSVRSSVSDIISDKAESVASAGSRNRGLGRFVTVGHSGSEESRGETYLGRDTLKKIRSLGSLGGQSDIESF